MTVRLNVVLDQLVAPTEPDLAMASRELAAALAAAAPAGCEVVGVLPAGAVERSPPAWSLRPLKLPRRELAAAWQVGVPTGAAGGMIHSPTLMAPLVKHDRVHDHDQTVVTLWDLRAWESPDELPRAAGDVRAGDAEAGGEARGCRRRADACARAAPRRDRAARRSGAGHRRRRALGLPGAERRRRAAARPRPAAHVRRRSPAGSARPTAWPTACARSRRRGWTPWCSTCRG